MKLARALAGAVLGWSVLTGAEAPTDWEAIVRPEPRFVLRNGASFPAEPVGLEGRDLVLLRSDGAGGSARQRIPRDQVLRIDWPGREAEIAAFDLLEREGAEAALPAFRAVVRQRLPLAALLAPADADALVAAAQAYLAAGRPTEAAGLARRLGAALTEPSQLTVLRDVQIVALLDLGLEEDAETEARAWIERADPSGSSALGWWVLARSSLRAGRPEEALWLALTPVTFAEPRPMAYLAECQAALVTAAVRLGLEGAARRWAREGAARGLSWPDDPALLPPAEAARWRTDASPATPGGESLAPAADGATSGPAAAADPSPTRLDTIRKLPPPRPAP